MPDHIVYLDLFTLREGSKEAYEKYATDMVEFIEANEPDIVSCSYYLGEDDRRGAMVLVASDAQAMDRHLELAAPRFQEGADLLETADRLLGGPASDQVVEMTRAYGGTIADKLAGFSRQG